MYVIWRLIVYVSGIGKNISIKTRALHGPEFRGPARPVKVTARPGLARFFFHTSQPGPALPVARPPGTSQPGSPGPARPVCVFHIAARTGPSIYVMRNIAISIVKQLATAKSCFSCIQDILLMSEWCQTVSSSGPYLVQIVSDFRSNEQPGPARGRSRPGPAWPVFHALLSGPARGPPGPCRALLYRFESGLLW